MRFEFTPEQVALRSSVSRLFESEAAPSALKSWWSTASGRSPRLWKGLAQIGVTGVLIPEEFGGLGGDEVDLCQVLEEAGRSCVPDAVLEGCVLAPVALLRAGTPEQRRTWLPRMASGDVRATVALGGTPHVPDAHVSDVVIVERADRLLLLERGEFTAIPLTSMDPSRRIFELQVADGAGAVLAADVATMEAIRMREHAGSAAILNGLAAAMLDRAVEYAKSRTQFGRTIGSFQAVKHQLAQAASLNALSLQATRSAAYRVARGQASAADAAVLARICAVEAEFESNRVALQVHGGIGFTWEHDLQLWLKHGKALEQAHGGHRALLAVAGAAGLAAGAANVF